MMSRPNPSYDVPESAPEEQAGDVGRKLIQAAISAVPVAGGPVAELMDIIRPSIERRRDEWVEDVAHELNRVRKRVKDLEDRDIANDQAFVTAVLNASTMALRTHQREKREALKNAVLNSALRNEPDEDLQAIFLELIDRFTGWHLRIQKYFDDPMGWLERDSREHRLPSMGGAGHLLEDAYPELRTRKEFYTQLVVDLAGSGLMGGGFLGTTMTQGGMLASRTTDLGRRFLAFIAEPDELHNESG
jgi:hypothetical protein